MPPLNESVCEVGNHVMTPKHVGYVIYSDTDNGIGTDKVCCRVCYAKHILRFYPDSEIAKYIRKNPSEYPHDEAPRIHDAQMQPGLFEVK